MNNEAFRSTIFKVDKSGFASSQTIRFVRFAPFLVILRVFPTTPRTALFSIIAWVASYSPT